MYYDHAYKGTLRRTFQKIEGVYGCVLRGYARKHSAYLFKRVLELFQKRKWLNFHEMRSNKTRNWLRSVANEKHEFSISHADIQSDRRVLATTQNNKTISSFL